MTKAGMSFLGAMAFVALLLVLAIAFALWTPDKPRAELEGKYLRDPSDIRQVLGVRLHVRDSGPREAPAVLLLHGFGSSLQTWDAWAADFSKDMRVVRLDLPGSGLSSPDPTGDYSDTRSMAVILALLDQLGIQRTTVIGNSIGGRIAWTFAARQMGRVSHLVLVSPDGFASPGFAYGRAADVPATLGLMRYVLPRWLLRMSLVDAYANPAALTPERAQRYHDLMLAPGSRDALLARMQQTVLVDPVPLLHAITAPTLLLWGRKDGMIPFDNAQDYLSAIPNSRLVPLDGVGHLPQEEAPERSAAVVRTFLRETGKEAKA
jgi:pimeloyl-ACP methyl ester carboxylesterase